MNLSVGIVGLPNVGKSTLFNALLKKQSSNACASAGQAGLGGAARVGNFPFTTIEPNVGVVPVTDQRLEKLVETVVEGFTSEESWLRKLSLPPSEVSRKRPPIVPATVKFVDIAGLVKGANKGEGLGNKFLSYIREVSIIAHVVRVFEDENIVREGSVDPKTDYETINTELILADIESLEKSKIMNAKKASILSSIDGKKRKTIEKIINSLNKGIPVRDMDLSGEEKELLREFFLLSAKPEIIVLNVSENDYNPATIESIAQKYKEMLKPVQHDNGGNIVVVSAKIEAELAELSHEEQKQYLSDLGVMESGLERLIKKAYQTLGLISFLTAGEKEVRAWTIHKGTRAVDAAGVIHTDFTKKFIKAEVVSYDDFVANNGWKGAREKGKARLEGRDYIIQDGDVVEFKIGS